MTVGILLFFLKNLVARLKLFLAQFFVHFFPCLPTHPQIWHGFFGPWIRRCRLQRMMIEKKGDGGSLEEQCNVNAWAVLSQSDASISSRFYFNDSHKVPCFLYGSSEWQLLESASQ